MWWTGHGRVLRRLGWPLRWLGAALFVGSGVFAILTFILGEYFRSQLLSDARYFLLAYWAYIALGASALMIVYLYGFIWRLLNPRVAIEFEDNSYYRRGESSPIFGISQVLYVGVRNTGAEPLPYCLAQLVDVKTDDGARPFQDMPVPLQRLEGHGPFPLRPDATKMARVVSAKQDGRDDRIVLHIVKDRGQGYTDVMFGIDASACTISLAVNTDRGTEKKRFRVYFDEKGSLRMVARRWWLR
jgi:hypothetical protein